MKPERLTLAGLQSYRQEQQVDFEQLCDSGVFGIFGPTGSGKSTILDAITLALYGQVERALNGTQGIMNQAEDELSVSFSFKLSHGHEQERYLIERQFKRGGDVSVHQTLSRLIQVTASGKTVLADKSMEVDRQVQQLLGLTMADFTRAVVLPQGKFSEFLSLRGRQRREMLQRLFHLEAYGQGLNQKLAARIKRNELKLKQLEAEQSGLGDASTEAVTQAKERLVEARSRQEIARKHWELQDQQYQLDKQKRAWQIELAALLEQRKKLDANQRVMQSLEQRLQHAADAMLLKPYLEQFEQAEQQLQLVQQQQTIQQKEFLTAKQSVETVRIFEQRASAELEKQETSLIVQVSHLREAVEWAQQLEVGQRQWQTAEQQVTKLQAAVDQLRTEVDHEGRLHAKALDKQATLQQEVARLEHTPDTRRKQRQLNLDRQTLAHVQEEVQKQRTDVVEKEHALRSLISEAAKLSETQSNYVEQGVQLADQIAHHKQIVTMLQNEAQHVHKRLTERIQQSKVAQREQQRLELAVQLASTLNEGVPCPVCGSCEHPHPVEQSDQPKKSVDDVAQLEERQSAVLRLQAELSQVSWQLDAAGRTHAEQMKEWVHLQSEQKEVQMHQAALAVAQEERSSAGDEPQKIKMLYAESEEDLSVQYQQLMARLTDCKQATERIQSELHEWSSASKQLLNKQRSLTAEHKSMRQMVNEVRRKVVDGEQRKKDLLAQWAIDYPDVQAEQATTWLQQFDLEERKVDELKERLAASVPFIEQTQSRQQKLDGELREREKMLIQVDSTRHHREEICRELEQKLHDRVGDKVPQQVLVETEQQLQQLRNTAKQARIEREQTEQKFVRISEQYTAVEEAVRSASERFEQVKKDWNERLNASRFAELAAVKAAFMTEEEHTQISNQVERFKEERAKIAQEEDRLQRLIGNQTITDEQWHASEQMWGQAKQQDEEALQLKAKAERDREDVQKRHERWRKLEKERQDEAIIQEQLGQLQRVFRGNAFVEFVAEEQLIQVSRDASARLGELTRQRYALEVDSTGGFLIRDNANGGVKRPVSTLSGGETFLTSLALALALSAQIQLRGKYPLEFFFLDEGFGSLDGELLETVISSLERLHLDRLSVGVISHVPELRTRLPRRLIIHPASPGGAGSTVEVETM